MDKISKDTTSDPVNVAMYSIAIIILIAVILCLFVIPYGDGMQYDVINPVSQYIDKDGGYHFRGILATSHCGTTIERVMGVKGYEFTVSKEVFDKSFTVSRMYFWYTCENGVPTNFTF